MLWTVNPRNPMAHFHPTYPILFSLSLEQITTLRPRMIYSHGLATTWAFPKIEVN
jgi:hypothetical protein